MKMDRSDEIQVLYEIASSIGEGVDLLPMLSKSLSIVLRKLNCSAGSIHLVTEGPTGTFGFQIKQSIPRTSRRHSSLREAAEYLPDNCDAKALTDWWQKLPLSGQIAEDDHFHILSLHPHGVLTMIRTGQALSEDLIKSLRPITRKLMSTIANCISKTKLEATLDKLQMSRNELKKYQSYLESMVQVRTDKLALTNAELKKEIEERILIEKELVEEKTKLQKALKKIRQLSGLLPICSSCMKIRDDGGYWNQIEKFIMEHSEVTFSHSICPDCAEEIYQDYKRCGDRKM